MMYYNYLFKWTISSAKVLIPWGQWLRPIVLSHSAVLNQEILLILIAQLIRINTVLSKMLIMRVAVVGGGTNPSFIHSCFILNYIYRLVFILNPNWHSTIEEIEILIGGGERT